MVSPQAQMIRDAVHAGMAGDALRAHVAPVREFVQEAIDAEREDLLAIANERDVSARHLRVLEYLEAWLTGPTKLEKNEHTRAHKLVEASQRKEVMNVDGGSAFIISSQSFAASHVFVVRHDWAGALGPAIEAAGVGIALPFDSCIFEFMISGRCVIVWAFQPEGEMPKAVPFVETPGGWWCGGADSVTEGTPFHSAWLQIVAICVALDTEVATREVMRAPAALNKKRERNGKPLVKDFSIVDLARRHRVVGPATGTHRSPRLHFRRGHWRHYEDHKTWIRWTMVGDPDLGFVEKQYRV
jgi:hypothetical protein